MVNGISHTTLALCATNILTDHILINIISRPNNCVVCYRHHAVLYEGQGGPVQSSSKPKVETLTLCSKVVQLLRPDVQHLLSHLTNDQNSSIYAATHPKIVQNTT